MKAAAFAPVGRALTVAAIAATTASCGLFGTSSEDPTVAYATAKERALLEIPPDLAGSQRQSMLRIPESGKGKIERSTLLPTLETIRLVRDGRVRWLELDVDARELWPSVKEFLTQRGYEITRDEPLTGLLETGWKDLPKEEKGGAIAAVTNLLTGPAAGSQERFRVRVERVTDADRPVRLFVTQRRISSAVVADASGRPTLERVQVKLEAERERETEFLLSLLVHLGVEQQAAKGILSSEELYRLGERAYLEEVEGELTLVVAESYDRVWTLTGEAIEDIGLDIENTVKSESRYEVLFEGVPPSGSLPEGEEQDGFFFGLFASDGEIEQYYNVYVMDEPGKARITLVDTTGSSVLPALEEEIMNRLYGQLR